MTAPTTTAGLEALRSVAAQLEQLHRRRDELIRELAVDDEVPMAHIARAAGLSRQHIYNLKKETPTQ